MDRGRQIDNIQNVNARIFDQFYQRNKTSVRTTNPPGGKSSICLGWSFPEPILQQRNLKKNVNFIQQCNQKLGAYNKRNRSQNNYILTKRSNNTANHHDKSNIKLNIAQRGISNIFFGTDDLFFGNPKKNTGMRGNRK